MSIASCLLHGFGINLNINKARSASGMNTLLHVTDNGLYCAQGDFYIDPWNPVGRAIITHSHSDHACIGSKRYLTAQPGALILRERVGPEPAIEGLDYGAPLDWNGVRISLHPAGHILGSAQVRIEYRGEIWVVSGDYKLEPDATCEPFEPIRCHTFVTESTFGLPIFRWRPETEIWNAINSWWRGNQEAGKASILFGYALGKAQRVIAGVDASLGPIFTHGAVERLNRLYRENGVALPQTHYAAEAARNTDWTRALIVAPPSCNGSPWMRRFGKASAGFASGWMRIRGVRRRRSIDRGFILSDHADWPSLLRAIEATGAERVWVTHGYRAPLVRWLSEKGLNAQAIDTRFEGERDEGSGELPQEPEA